MKKFTPKKKEQKIAVKSKELKNWLWILALQQASKPAHSSKLSAKPIYLSRPLLKLGHKSLILALLLGGLWSQTSQAENQFHWSYEFTEGHCSTQAHELSAKSDQQLHQQLCELLPNEEKNQSCALLKRQQLFAKECVGYSWPQPKPEPEPPTLVSLGQLMVERTEVFENHPRMGQSNKKQVVDKQLLQAQQGLKNWLKDAQDCGVSANDVYVGEACLRKLRFTMWCGTSEMMARNAMKKVVWDEETGEERWFLRILEQAGNKDLIRIRQKKNDTKPYTAEIFSIPEEIRIQDSQKSLQTWLDSQPKPIAQLWFSSDPNHLAWQRINNPQNLRELYHAIMQVWPLASSKDMPSKTNSVNPVLSVEKRQQILKSVLDHPAFWKNSPSPAESYHEGILAWILENQLLPKAEFLSLCRLSMDSNLSEPSEIAAIFIFEEQPKQNKLRPFVFEALRNRQKEIRLQAIRSLQKIKPTTEEQETLLSLLNNEDDLEIHHLEFLLALQGPFVAHSLWQEVNELAKHKQAKVRHEAAIFYGKLSRSDPNNAFHLIELLQDSDSMVRQEALAQLFKVPSRPRRFVDALERISALQPALEKNPDLTIRKGVAQLLYQMGTKEALGLLKTQLAKEQSEDFKNFLFTLIKKNRRY